MPRERTEQAIPFDGNGNVIGLVDMATGVKSATYDYNAFGETIQSDGVAAAANHCRFSTKYTDDETKGENGSRKRGQTDPFIPPLFQRISPKLMRH